MCVLCLSVHLYICVVFECSSVYLCGAWVFICISVLCLSVHLYVCVVFECLCVCVLWSSVVSHAWWVHGPKRTTLCCVFAYKVLVKQKHMDLIHCLKHCAALRAELDLPNEKYMDLTELHCVVLCRFPARIRHAQREMHGPDRIALCCVMQVSS